MKNKIHIKKGDNVVVISGKDKDKNTEEEVIINENYAESELMEFEGTIEEIYDDGSMLVYSPIFRTNFDYNIIIELDENSIIDDFEVRENQLVKFSIYSAVKKSNPLTAVAKSLTLISETSNQKAQEQEYQKGIQDAIDKIEGKE